MAMAEADRRTGTALRERLLREANRFDFFQAVRILEFIAREAATETPERPPRPVGLDWSPRDEVIRFRGLPSLSFPAAEIDQITHWERVPEDEDHPPLEMVVTFMGLAGPQGVLPRHYTSLVIERSHDKNRDYSLRDFFDLFNHRTISLFFRVWEKYRYPFSYERFQLERSGDEDLFTYCLRSLVGLATPGLAHRLQVDDEAVLFYAGHYAHRPRSALALEHLLADYFDLPVVVEQFQGQWLLLPEDERTRMPSSERPSGTNCQLGLTAVAGARIWSVQTKFRVRVGPLTYRQFCSFMPNGRDLRRLQDLVRLYVGPELDFDVQLELLADEVPRCQISAEPHRGSRLGWNSWLKVRPFPRNAEDAVFQARSR